MRTHTRVATAIAIAIASQVAIAKKNAQEDQSVYSTNTNSLPEHIETYLFSDKALRRFALSISEISRIQKEATETTDEFNRRISSYLTKSLHGSEKYYLIPLQNPLNAYRYDADYEVFIGGFAACGWHDYKSAFSRGCSSLSVDLNVNSRTAQNAFGARISIKSIKSVSVNLLASNPETFTKAMDFNRTWRFRNFKVDRSVAKNFADKPVIPAALVWIESPAIEGTKETTKEATFGDPVEVLVTHVTLRVRVEAIGVYATGTGDLIADLLKTD